MVETPLAAYSLEGLSAEVSVQPSARGLSLGGED
jgi:hypothetical protein